MTGPAVDAGVVPARAPSRLWRVLTSLPGPIFFKELNTTGRRASTYWLRGLFALGLTALVSLVFLGNYLDAMDTRGAARLQQFQTLAPITTACIVWFEFVALTFAAAARCGGAICDERRKGSLASLLTTPLRTYQIILGKVFGGMAELMLLALTGLPLLLAVRFFGGLTIEAVVACFSIIISSILMTCAATVLCSIFAKRAPAAMLTGLGLAAGIQFMPILVIGVAQWANLPVNPALIFQVSSPFTLGFVTATLVFGASGPVGLGPVSIWWISPLYSFACAGLLSLVAVAALRVSVAREASGESAVVAATAKANATGKRRKFWQSKPRRSPGTSRLVGDAPVLWREGQQQQPVLSRATLVKLAVVTCVFVLLWSRNDPSDQGIHVFVAVVFSLLSVVTAAGTSASGISAERESRTLDVLLASPLSAREIIWGKFIGNLSKLWLFPLILMLHQIIVACGIAGMSPVVLPMYLIVLVPPIAALAASGVWLSAWSKNTGTASAANFATAVLLWLGLPMLMALMGEIFGSGRLSGDLAGIAALPNPIGQTVIVTLAGMESRGSLRFDLYGMGKVSLAEYGGVLLGYVAFYAVITWGMLRLAAGYLRRTSNRTQ